MALEKLLRREGGRVVEARGVEDIRRTQGPQSQLSRAQRTSERLKQQPQGLYGSVLDPLQTCCNCLVWGFCFGLLTVGVGDVFEFFSLLVEPFFNYWSPHPSSLDMGGYPCSYCIMFYLLLIPMGGLFLLEGKRRNRGSPMKVGGGK